MSRRVTRSEIFREWFGVNPAAGRLVARLQAADGEPVRHADLLEVTGQTKHGMDMSLKRLRAAMAAGSIISLHGFGYQLSDAGKSDCDRALEDARKRGVA